MQSPLACFECGFCSRVFTNCVHLNHHMQADHGPNPITYRCPLQDCSCGTQDQASLKAHLALIHSSIRPYACPICSKAFKLRSHLRKHEQSRNHAAKFKQWAGFLEPSHDCPRNESDPLNTYTFIRTKMQQLREEYLALSPLSDATKPLESLSDLYSLTGYYPSIVLDQREVTIVPNPHPIGEGGFGECWKGIFLGNHSVAMKCARSLVPEETAIRRTSRELELYLVSPWMVNGDAREFVNRHPDVNRVVLILQAAKGLCYLHTCNPAIVHGDLKAANVLISKLGEARIADFGLSRRAITGISLGYSDTWRLAGNARWQAPELLLGLDDEKQERRTIESDMFAFGRFMIEIYTGEIPFSNFSDFAVLVSLARGMRLLPIRPTEPEVVSRGLDDDAWKLITECCHEEPAHRLPAQALVSWLEDRAQVEHYRLPRAGPIRYNPYM
ncbi:hypothetical protein BOTBODRAFT_243939 [Botryobasidium botryosum FD-172 SS1]|uniref:Protein kinase domain-containing protein n=1 Tax=Botryobasidium botryosum (strain FD-172 SS1) TaxID=930990 RepID=A0A067LWK4_BOTB1|nr:hypothetical protein BOTBODRAFT_243939 [Botryobasidium botryosum FD-172 SS1]